MHLSALCRTNTPSLALRTAGIRIVRILWIGPWRADALCAQVRGSMARALHDLGNEIGTVVIGESGSWHTGGYDWVHYCPVPCSFAGKLMNQARIARIIAGFKGDVLVLGEKVAHLAAVAALVRCCLRRKWRIMIDIRTLPIPDSDARRAASQARRFWRQLRIGFRFTDAWMAITSRLRQSIDAIINTRSLPCAIWQSAAERRFIECDDVEPAENIAKCGHDWNILYLGSLAKGRRIDLAVRAMAEFENPDGKVGLHIVGSGDHLPELRELVKDLKVADTVHIWEPVPYSEVPSTILACQLGILPLPDCDAWNTSSALKLYEYLSLGIAILVSDIPAHQDAVGRQPFAFFMDDYSTKGFNEALSRFLACSEHEYCELREQAKAFVRSGHTWNHRAQVIHRFLTNIQKGQE